MWQARCGGMRLSGCPTEVLALLVGPDQKWLSTIDYPEKVDTYLNKALVGW